jgi:hypothetical protein
MNCSVATKSVKRVCYSHGRTLLEHSGGGENEEEKTTVRKVENESREECENSREIVRRRGWCFLGRSNGKISLLEYM